MRGLILLLACVSVASAATISVTHSASCIVVTEPYGNIPAGETCPLSGVPEGAAVVATVDPGGVMLSVSIFADLVPEDYDDLTAPSRLLSYQTSGHASLTFKLTGGTGIAFTFKTATECGNDRPEGIGGGGFDSNFFNGPTNCQGFSELFALPFNVPITHYVNFNYSGSRHGYGTAYSGTMLSYSNIMDGNGIPIQGAQFVEIFIPEPSPLALMASGFLGMLLWRRR